MLEKQRQMPISLMLIQETTNSLFKCMKAERGGGATDKSLVQNSASCTGPGPSETNREAGSAASMVGALPTVPGEVTCLLIFNIEETDPFLQNDALQILCY